MPHRLIQDDGFVRFLSRFPAFRERTGPAGAGEIAQHVAATIAISAIATTLRFWADPYLPPGFPYLTFFPAVILTGFIFGMRAALLSVVLCGLAAWYWFIPPGDSFELTYQSGVALAFYVVVVTIDLGILQLALQLQTAQTRHDHGEDAVEQRAVDAADPASAQRQQGRRHRPARVPGSQRRTIARRSVGQGLRVRAGGLDQGRTGAGRTGRRRLFQPSLPGESSKARTRSRRLATSLSGRISGERTGSCR